MTLCRFLVGSNLATCATTTTPTPLPTLHIAAGAAVSDGWLLCVEQRVQSCQQDGMLIFVHCTTVFQRSAVLDSFGARVLRVITPHGHLLEANEAPQSAQLAPSRLSALTNPSADLRCSGAILAAGLSCSCPRHQLEPAARRLTVHGQRVSDDSSPPVAFVRAHGALVSGAAPVCSKRVLSSCSVPGRVG